jgi:hypothetical protein
VALAKGLGIDVTTLPAYLFFPRSSSAAEAHNNNNNTHVHCVSSSALAGCLEQAIPGLQLQ